MNPSLRVLIVDDHGPTRALLRSFMRSEGWSVVGEAATAEEAFKMLGQLQPDVVCLDVVMPGLSGTDLLKQVKAEFAQVAVVMVTGNATPEVVQAAMEGGADGFLVKPFDRERIVQTLSSAVRKHQVKPALGS